MIAGGQTTLFVADVGAAIRFYVETLGMKLVETDDASKARYAVIDAGEGMRIALHDSPGGAAKRAKGMPKVGLYPKLPIREAIAILENRGVAFDVSDDGKTTLATFEDPDGNVLYLRQTR